MRMSRLNGKIWGCSIWYLMITMTPPPLPPSIFWVLHWRWAIRSKKKIFFQVILYLFRSKFLSSFNSILKSLTIHQEIWSFLPLCTISRHCKSLTPSKSMAQKSNHDVKEKNIIMYVRVQPNPCLLIKDILTKNYFFCVRQRFRKKVRHIMT